jgi:hypothetical protein
MTQFPKDQTHLAKSARTPNWRLSLDDAWRSEALRHRFEKETGLSPLGVTARDAEEQTARGYTANYHEKFVVWATRVLKLEDLAPHAIREKLTAR